MRAYRKRFINSYLKSDKDAVIEYLGNRVVDLESILSYCFINEDKKVKELERKHRQEIIASLEFQEIRRREDERSLALDRMDIERDRINLYHDKEIYRINTDYSKACENNASKEKIEELKCNRDIEIARIESKTKLELSKNETSVKMAKLETDRIGLSAKEPLVSASESLSKLDSEMLSGIDESHVLITGTTGGGKSEVIKTIANHHITRSSHSLILIDPKDGELASQVHRLKGHSTKAILFKPLSRKNKHVFNVFDINKSYLKDNETIISSSICSGMTGMFDLSDQMETLLTPHIKLMLHCKGSFSLLRAYLKGDAIITRERYGKKAYKLDNRIKKDYGSELYTKSRDALIRRLDKLNENSEFMKATTGKSTINIAEVGNKESLIIDLAGMKDKELLGALIISTVQFTGRSVRGSNTYLIVDECHHFQIEPLIPLLTESRADKLFTILATQFIGRIKNAKLKEAILESTSIKISTQQSNSDGALSTCKLLSLDKKEVTTLKTLEPNKGELYISSKGGTGIKIINPSNLVGEKGCTPLEGTKK